MKYGQKCGLKLIRINKWFANAFRPQVFIFFLSLWPLFTSSLQPLLVQNKSETRNKNIKLCLHFNICLQKKLQIVVCLSARLYLFYIYTRLGSIGIKKLQFSLKFAHILNEKKPIIIVIIFMMSKHVSKPKNCSFCRSKNRFIWNIYRSYEQTHFQTNHTTQFFTCLLFYYTFKQGASFINSNDTSLPIIIIIISSFL